MSNYIEKDDDLDAIKSKLTSYIAKHPNDATYYKGIFRPSEFKEPEYNIEKNIDKEEEPKKESKLDLLNDLIFSDKTNQEKFSLYNEILKTKSDDEDNVDPEDIRKTNFNYVTGSYRFKNRDQFVAFIIDDIKRISEQYNINPRVMLSQALIETNNGKSIPGNNMFGIKGPGQILDTEEEINGEKVKTKAEFKTYSSLIESMEDYAKLISSSNRYKSTVGKISKEDFNEVIDTIISGGYATAGHYNDLAKQINTEIDKWF